MTDTDSGETPAPQSGNGGTGGPPSIRVVAQFIRDLSFENPRAPDSLRADQGQPSIEIGVELNARGRPDNLFEVDLKLSATAKRAEEPAFQVEVVFGGLFQIGGVAQQDLEAVLLIECPRFLFPFARRIIADVTSDGGFPPLLLDPIDFVGVYEARRAQGQVQMETGQA